MEWALPVLVFLFAWLVFPRLYASLVEWVARTFMAPLVAKQTGVSVEALRESDSDRFDRWMRANAAKIHRAMSVVIESVQRPSGQVAAIGALTEMRRLGEEAAAYPDGTGEAGKRLELYRSLTYHAYVFVGEWIQALDSRDSAAIDPASKKVREAYDMLARVKG